jgi:hypothetical protein
MLRYKLFNKQEKKIKMNHICIKSHLNNVCKCWLKSIFDEMLSSQKLNVVNFDDLRSKNECNCSNKKIFGETLLRAKSFSDDLSVSYRKEPEAPWVEGSGISGYNLLKVSAVWKTMSKIINSLFVSGGSITSLYLNDEPNDYDFYLKDKSIADLLIEFYLGKFNEHNHTNYFWSKEFQAIYKFKKDYHNDLKPSQADLYKNWEELVDVVPAISSHNLEDKPGCYEPVCITPNAISLTNNIQIVTRFTGEPEEVIKNFDFVHTNNYYLFKENKLVTKPEAIESILTKQLIYNGSKFPICSLIRTKKFIERGWKVSAGEYLKISFQLKHFDLYNIKTLKEQLIGVDAKYFIKFLDMLDKADEISEENIFNLLNTVFEEVGE